MKKILYITIVLMMILTNFVYASVGSKEETLQYMGVKLSIDGNEIVPMDVNKNVVNPFIIDGTTFLPVRAFSEALGKEVKWEGDTNSIYITSKNDIKKQEMTSSDATAYTADIIKSLQYQDITRYILLVKIAINMLVLI